MASLLIYILILLVIAAVIILVSIYRYNRHLDKVTKGEVHDTHSSIPEPRTTAGVSYKVVLMVIVIMTFIGVSTVNGIVSSMQARMNNLESDMRNLYSQMYQMQEDLKKQSSHIENFTYTMGDVNLDTCKVPIDSELMLKEYTDDTIVSFVVGGKTYDMNYEGNGIYTLSIERDLFDDDYDAQVVIKEPGRNFTEYVDYPSSLYYDYLPMPNFNCSFSSGNRLGKMEVEGNYTLLMGNTDDIESMQVTYVSNGEDLKTIDITTEAINGETIYVDKGLEVNHDLTMRFEIVTKSGFKIVEQQMMVFEEVNYPYDYEYTRIYDSTGNLIWEDFYR